MAAKKVRILKARSAGTGSAGPGVTQPTQVAGLVNSTGAPRSGSVKDATTLRSLAAMRARVRSTMGRTAIGSKGRL